MNNLIKKFKTRFNLTDQSNNNEQGEIDSITSTPSIASTSLDPLLLSTPNSFEYGTIQSNSNLINKNNKQKTTTTSKSSNSSSSKPRKLRSKLLCILVTILLAICVYASFQDDFLDVVEAGISCGTCLSLLVPLQALAHVGDDAFVDFFVNGCIKLRVSPLLSLFYWGIEKMTNRS